jgi:hypothetical protein
VDWSTYQETSCLEPQDQTGVGEVAALAVRHCLTFLYIFIINRQMIHKASSHTS